MARNLQDRLALANYKTQNGQEHLSLQELELRLETEIKQKRMLAGLETSSTGSSSSSERQSYTHPLASSPLIGHFISDDIATSGNFKKSRKRGLYLTEYADMEMPKSKRSRSYSMAPPTRARAQSSRKGNPYMTQSSPILSRHESNFSTSHGPNMSFTSEISTVAASPPLDHISEEDRDAMRQNSHHSERHYMQSSPPRTPSPSSQRRNKSAVNGDEGAGLLLFLAGSPSAPNAEPKGTCVLAPSTPPSREHNHFAAALNTPGLLGFGTPGQQFNLADFCHVTPSPAQGAFGNRTPALNNRTPSAVKEARRKLNGDDSAPSGSPPVSNVRRVISREGLGMDLGGELSSRRS